MTYFMSVTANYGIVFFMPQIIKRIGLSNAMTGVVSSVPYIIGTIGLVAWGWSSDRKGERRWHLIVASTLGAAGLVFSGLPGASYWRCSECRRLPLASTAPARMPSIFLTGTAAAGTIAMINAVGNLGGYVGPLVVGWIKDSTGSFQANVPIMMLWSSQTGRLSFSRICLGLRKRRYSSFRCNTSHPN